jgi:DNA-binding XRE family transcriptional regulator
MNLELKMQILRSGKRQVALAHEIGIAEPKMSKIVNGWIDPKNDLKQRIAEALNCEPQQIFGDFGRNSEQL